MVLLRGVFDEILDFREWAAALHQLFGIVPEDVRSLHGLKHLLKGVLFSLPQSVIEFDSIGLILLVFGLDFEIVLLIDGLEKLADIGLYIPFLCPEYLLLALPPALLFIVLNHQALVLHLRHPKQLQPLLVGLNEVHHRAVLYPIQDRVLVEQPSLLQTKEKLGFVILEIFVFCELIELRPKILEGSLVFLILGGLFLLLLPLPQVVLQQLLQGSEKDNVVVHRLTVHHRTRLYFIPDYY